MAGRPWLRQEHSEYSWSKFLFHTPSHPEQDAADLVAPPFDQSLARSFGRSLNHLIEMVGPGFGWNRGPTVSINRFEISESSIFGRNELKT